MFVCHDVELWGLSNIPGQADKIPKLEKESGWREEQFDYILQFMRTVLLKRMSRSSLHVLVTNSR